MQGKGYIDFIYDEEKKPLYENSFGLIEQGDPATLLKSDGQPAHLQASPDGWKETLVKYGRSVSWLGLFREMTVPMRFTKDGAKILRYIFWNKGIEGICYFVKTKLDRLAYPPMYDNWFIGEIDLSEMKQNRINNTVTANVMEGGISKLFKANENTVYEIPVNTDVERKILYLDGVPFTNKIDWIVYNGQEIIGTPTPQYYWLGMGIISQEGTTQGIITQDAIFEPTSVFPNNGYTIWSLDKTITVHITGKVSGVCTYSNGPSKNSVFILNARVASDSTNTVYQDIPLSAGGAFKEGDVFNVDIDFIVTLQPNRRLYFRTTGVPWTQHLFTITQSQITAEYDVTFNPSYCECLTPFRLFEKLAEKMFDGKYGVKSDFLTGLSDILYTSGPALRKYESKSTIKTTIADLFQDLKLRGNKKYSIGLGIENDKLVIEELDYFFTNDTIIDLGVVDDFEISVAKDLMFNTIKVGYKNQQIDKVNGRDEFNVTSNYGTPITRVVKEMNLVSPYRADMYGIEVTRINLYGKDTTDDKADNETFVISAEKQPISDYVYFVGAFQTFYDLGTYYIRIPSILSTLPNGTSIIISGTAANDGTYTVENTSYLIVGFTTIRVTQPVTTENVSGTGLIKALIPEIWKLKRPLYTSVTGVLHPSVVFNTELSPARSLINNGGLIHSLIDKCDINKLKFLLSDKNSELSTTIGATTITEKADIVIGSLQNKLFLPYYFTFTTQVPIDFLSIMKTNPYGKIKFTDAKTGNSYKGYMFDGGIKPEPTDKQQWKLISCNQILTTLI